jgi:hypothetical protein
MFCLMVLFHAFCRFDFFELTLTSVRGMLQAFNNAVMPGESPGI